MVATISPPPTAAREFGATCCFDATASRAKACHEKGAHASCWQDKKRQEEILMLGREMMGYPGVRLSCHLFIPRVRGSAGLTWGAPGPTALGRRQTSRPWEPVVGPCEASAALGPSREAGPP